MRKVVSIILFITGLIICLYPVIAKVYYNYDMNQASKKYDTSFKSMSSDHQRAYMQYQQYNKRIKYNSEMIEAPKVKVKKDDKKSNFSPSADVIATIRIPKLKLHYPVYDKATPENLNRGVSHVTGTSYPLGGINTNSVFAAHSYSPTHEWFTHIDRLNNGDKVIINNYKEKLYYKVVDRIIVTPDQVEAMSIRKGKDMITLLTCTPDGTKRLLIYAIRDNEHLKSIMSDNPLKSEQTLIGILKIEAESWWIFIIILILIIAMLKRMTSTK